MVKTKYSSKVQLKKLFAVLFITLIYLQSPSVFSQNTGPSPDNKPAEGSINKISSYDLCLLTAIRNNSADTTVDQLKTQCQKLLVSSDISETAILENGYSSDIGPVTLRGTVEDLSKNTPFILTANRANYLLPAVYTPKLNSDLFNDALGEDALGKVETHFQISIKAPITEGILFDDDSFWIAYTMRAFWQSYNGANSRPFRDTNHEPEFIWETHSGFDFFGLKNSNNQLVLNHQSNGQYGDFSRSWNRLIFNSTWERQKLALTLSAWERLPDDEDDDDNPDIEDFLGNAQLLASYGSDNHRASILIRGNPIERKGALELTWSFPITGSEKIRGMMKYFDGYGESLLDYNVETRSFGLGIQITDWF